MSSSFKSGNVTFVVSGNRAAEFTGYLSQLNKTAAFSDQIAFISGQGFSTVVITTDPNDLPRSIRSSLYNQVYQTKMNIFDDKGKPIIGEDGKPQTKTIEVSGLTSDVIGNSTAYILMNDVAGVDVAGNVRSIAALTHEIYHIGYTNSRLHPPSWQAHLTAQLIQIDPNLANEAMSPELKFNHSATPKPVLNSAAPQNSGIVTAKDLPAAYVEHIEYGGGVIDETISATGQITNLSFFTYDTSKAFDFRKMAIPELYETLLGRDPDAAGLNYWMNNGTTLQGISTAFMSSPEFHLRQDISAVYQSSLGRSIDNDTLNTYVKNGLTATQVKADIEGSLIYREHIITQDYERMLNREPDAAGLSWFAASKLTLDQIAKTIQDSSEYHQLHPTTPASLLASGKFVDVPTIFKPVEITKMPDFVAAPISVVNVSSFYNYVDVMHPVDYFPSLTSLINSIKNSPSYQQTPSYSDPLDFSTPLAGPRIQIWDAASGAWYP